ncbi:quinon protein alcohol dehydrogenase-like superfamily [Suillus ampliporus]|nr:quinon protein alcohol dehydrogenase-like superfamily [Suillus ampliporus]
MSSPTSKKQQTPAVTASQMMRGHTEGVECVVHLPGGRNIITGSSYSSHIITGSSYSSLSSSDGSLRLWDLESGTQIGEDWREEGRKVEVEGLALSPDGKTVASGSSDGTVRLWDVEIGKVIAKWTVHTYTVHSVCWSADGERVMSGSDDGMAIVWDVKIGKTVLTIKTGHTQVWAVIYSPDQSKIATGGYTEDAVKIWDAKTGELLDTLEHFMVLSLAWTSDGKKLISGSYGQIRIFDTATCKEIAILEGHTHWVTGLSLSPNDRLLASASLDKTARLWNLDTNLPVGPPLQHTDYLRCAVFSVDAKLLVTGCADTNAYVWDTQPILKQAGLEDLLSISNVPAAKSLLNSDATRRPPRLKDPRRLPPGFFDDVRTGVHSSGTRSVHPRPSARHRTLASSSANPLALLGRFSTLFRRSPSDTSEAIELQRRPRSTLFSPRGPRVVEVPTVQDRRSLVVARPQGTTPSRPSSCHYILGLSCALAMLCISSNGGTNTAATARPIAGPKPGPGVVIANSACRHARRPRHLLLLDTTAPGATACAVMTPSIIGSFPATLDIHRLLEPGTLIFRTTSNHFDIARRTSSAHHIVIYHGLFDILSTASSPPTGAGTVILPLDRAPPTSLEFIVLSRSEIGGMRDEKRFPWYAECALHVMAIRSQNDLGLMEHVGLGVIHEGAWVASSAKEKDLNSGAQIGDDWRDEGDEAAVWTIALSSDDNTFASGSGDGTVRLWDLETGKVISKWTGHTSDVQSMCWSANAGLQDLHSIPNVSARKSLVNSDAMQRPTQFKNARRLPAGFFNDTRDSVHSSADRNAQYPSQFLCPPPHSYILFGESTRVPRLPFIALPPLSNQHR